MHALIDRCKAMILLCAVGDAYGVAYEIKSKEEIVALRSKRAKEHASAPSKHQLPCCRDLLDLEEQLGQPFLAAGGINSFMPSG